MVFCNSTAQICEVFFITCLDCYTCPAVGILLISLSDGAVGLQNVEPDDKSVVLLIVLDH